MLYTYKLGRVMALLNLVCAWKIQINFENNRHQWSDAQYIIKPNYLSIPKRQRCKRWSFGIKKYFHITFYIGCDF